VNRLSPFCCLATLTVATFAADRQGKEQRFFDQRVTPILIRRCLPCHNDELKNGEITFLDRNSLLKGGPRGPAIVPGQPEASVLIRSLKHDGDLQMPPGPKLPPKEIAILTDWIRRGAMWGKLRTPAAPK
jgi:hypothetical protein